MSRPVKEFALKHPSQSNVPSTHLTRRSVLRSSLIGSVATIAAPVTGLAGGLLVPSAMAATPASASGIGNTVETTAGRIRGAVRNGIQTFRSVPYGATTAAPNRFMPPRKPEPWTGVKDVFMSGHVAQQIRPLYSAPAAGAGDRANCLPGDDCLTINIFTPGTDAKKRPVMFWIHGGGYTVGSGLGLEYDGTNLASTHDVVVVCVNHRLNIFGFLYLGASSERYADAGNVGMLDLVAALEWVRDNVANFGGDPGNVTIFGQSGGGGKVSTLLAMPSAKGLFHKAIVESGSTLKQMRPDDAQKTTDAVLRKLNVSTSNLDRLQDVTTDEITVASLTIGLSDPHRAMHRFGPVVDGRSLPRDPFDPDAPAVSADIPMLINTVETEGGYFADDSLLNMNESQAHQALEKRFGAETDRVLSTFRPLHPNATPSELYLIITSFPMNAIKQAERKAALGRAPVYASLFKWRTPIEDGRRYSPHGVEMPFVFNNVWLVPEMVGVGPELQPLADKVSSAWVNFARTGKPSAAGTPAWPAYNASSRSTMLIDNQWKVADDPSKPARELLLSLPPQPMF